MKIPDYLTGSIVHEYSGITCPSCNGDTEVINSRKQTGYIRRRRQCIKCGNRITTKEYMCKKGE